MSYLTKLFYRDLDLEKRSIVTGGLRRVSVICRESASSCAALAASGSITKILNGFKNVFTQNDSRYQGTYEINFIFHVKNSCINLSDIHMALIDCC